MLSLEGRGLTDIKTVKSTLTEITTSRK